MLIPTTAAATHDWQLELQSMPWHSWREQQEVEMLSSPVDDDSGEPTCSPSILVRAPAIYDGPITRQRVRELAWGLREKIIFEGNEDSPGEGENKEITVDTREEESEVLEEVGDMTE